VADRVIMRRWRAAPHTIIALFPEMESDRTGLINSYEHVGQHGNADYNVVVARTRPVPYNDPEAQELMRELRQIGYDPIMFKRRVRRRNKER
jgi:hypothetical protein